MIIAVDGPAGAGKGTLACLLAEHFRLAHMDTGLLYRAVGRCVLEIGADPADAGAATAAAAALGIADLDHTDLRDEKVGAAASTVAAIPAVRTALLDFQRTFAHAPPGDVRGSILDGRDVGTVICPDADVKLYVTASTEIRARRRHEELRTRGVDSIYSRVLADVKARDERDSGRSTAPLRPAKDAIVLDTSDLDIDAAFQAARRIVEAVEGIDHGGRQPAS